MSEVFVAVRKIKGREQLKIYIINENGKLYSTKEEICNKLTYTFSLLFNTHNYSQEFRIINRKAEKTDIEFGNDHIGIYNRALTIRLDLEEALRHSR